MRFLDRGVQGIIAPHVDTRQEAESVARSAKYYPDGHRGVGIARAHDYGMTSTLNESKSWVNSQTMVLPMIEDTEAVANLDEILTVPGLMFFSWRPTTLAKAWGTRARKQWRT